jgi:hypothetical protein
MSAAVPARGASPDVTNDGVIRLEPSVANGWLPVL